ncbi:MAG: helix-turn-helix domain-containing protein [Clostridia bacterium]|nr:helix-turn-helix domain-containing protein [Clostridia bacterium]
MDYIDRIKARKSEKKITNEQLSELTGIPVSTLSKILAGFSDSPKLSNIVAICDALDCSVDYILSGVPENTNNYTLEPDEMRLVEDFRTLDRHGREMVRLVLDKESERVTMDAYETAAAPRGRVISEERARARFAAPLQSVANTARKTPGFEKRQIPLYGLPVSAGPGEYLDDSAAETITIPDNPKTADADFALRISGNSMEPKYHDGDVLLVENCDAVEPGEAAVFILDGNGYFKIFSGDRLVSLNPEYGDILLRGFEDVHCAGRVVGKLKRK